MFDSLDILRYACFSQRVFHAWSSLRISRHRLDTLEARTKVLGSSTNSKIYTKISRQRELITHAPAYFETQLIWQCRERVFLEPWTDKLMDIAQKVVITVIDYCSPKCLLPQHAKSGESALWILFVEMFVWTSRGLVALVWLTQISPRQNPAVVEPDSCCLLTPLRYS
jgi:hypothetical protein